MNHHRPFLALWVLAVSAAVAAFVLHLALRSRTMQLGYELGRARAEQARMREVRRVLELEVASYQTPQRVEVVARTLLSMSPPTPERIFVMPAVGGVSGGVAAPAMSGIGGVVAGGAAPPGTYAQNRAGAYGPMNPIVPRPGDSPAGATSLPAGSPPGELILPTITPPKPAATTNGVNVASPASTANTANAAPVDSPAPAPAVPSTPQGTP